MSHPQEIVPLLRLAQAGTPHVIDNALMLGELTNKSLFDGLVSIITDKKIKGSLLEAAIERLGTFADDPEFSDQAFESLRSVFKKKRSYDTYAACQLCKFGAKGLEEVKNLFLRREGLALEPPKYLMQSILNRGAEAIPLIITLIENSWLGFRDREDLIEKLKEFGDDIIEPILDHLIENTDHHDSITEILALRSQTAFPLLKEMALGQDLKDSKIALKVLSHFADYQDRSIGTILDRIKLDLEAAEKKLEGPREIHTVHSKWSLKRIFRFFSQSKKSSDSDKTEDPDPLEAFYDLQRSCTVAGFGNTRRYECVDLNSEGTDVLFRRAPNLILRAAQLISSDRFNVPYNPADDVLSLILIRDVAGETHYNFAEAYIKGCEKTKAFLLKGLKDAVCHLNSVVCEPLPISEIDESFQAAIEFSRHLDPTDRSDMSKLNATASLLQITKTFHNLTVQDLGHPSFEIRQEAFHLTRAIDRSGVGTEITGDMREVLSQAVLSNIDPHYMKTIDPKKRFDYFRSFSDSLESEVIDRESAILGLAIILDDVEFEDLHHTVIYELGNYGRAANFIVPRLDKVLRGTDSNLSSLAAESIAKILKD